MMNNDNFKIKDKNTGISFIEIITVVFIVLKLLNKISWSWWWVFSPILLLLIVVFGLIFIIFIINIIKIFISNCKNKRGGTND